MQSVSLEQATPVSAPGPLTATGDQTLPFQLMIAASAATDPTAKQCDALEQPTPSTYVDEPTPPDVAETFHDAPSHCSKSGPTLDVPTATQLAASVHATPPKLALTAPGGNGATPVDQVVPSHRSTIALGEVGSEPTAKQLEMLGHAIAARDA